MISRLKPNLLPMLGFPGIEDLWFVRGDPISYMSDLCEESMQWLFGVQLNPLESIRISVHSEILSKVFQHKRKTDG